MKTKDEQLEIFRTFLNANDAFSLWLKRTNEVQSSGARDFIDTNSWENWIINAFGWGSVPGIDWCELDGKWRNIIKIRGILPSIFNISFWSNCIVRIKSKFKYLRWRFKFKKIKFYSLRGIDRCHNCDALSTCAGSACPCNKNEQLKLRKKKK